MSNLVFPTLACLPQITRTRIDNTSIYETASGKEQRLGRWAAPRYRYRLPFNFLRSATGFAELQALEGFAARVRGAFDSFLWSDPEDNAATAHAFAAGNGSATTFQLQRSLVPDASLPAAASRSFYPVIGDGYEPVYDLASVPTIYVGGVLKTSGTDYVLGANGVVTFTAAPALAAVLTWTGTWWKRVRFAGDELSVDQIVQRLWKAGSVELITVPVGAGNVYVIPPNVSTMFDGALLYP